MSKQFVRVLIVRVFTIVSTVIIGTPNLSISQVLQKQVSVARDISEESFVQINGIDQWITIHGDSTKPVALFLHGGPGSPMSPYSSALYKKWEKEFVIVQWDQRGTGRTFGQTAPTELTPEYLSANPLTTEQMVTDGILVAEYLLKRLNKKRVILLGTSWGSVLGVKIASKRPDLFYAYIGHSQISQPPDDLTLYNRVYALSEEAKDTASLSILKNLGMPPYAEAGKIGKLFRIVKKYERLRSTLPPDAWFVEAPGYDNPKDNQNRADGDDYSFVNYVGDKKLGVMPIRAKLDIAADYSVFKIPVYFIQGEEDLLTPKEASRKYFDNIKAPEKEYFLLPKTAHGFNESVLETQYRICKKIRT